MPRGRTKIDFTDFWNAYGRKFDRTAALRAWGRLTDLDRRAALRGIPSYRDECLRQGIAMMYPHGYLTHRRWEDEREEATVSAGSPIGTKKEQSPTPPAAADALSDMETW